MCYNNARRLIDYLVKLILSRPRCTSLWTIAALILTVNFNVRSISTERTSELCIVTLICISREFCHKMLSQLNFSPPFVYVNDLEE